VSGRLVRRRGFLVEATAEESDRRNRDEAARLSATHDRTEAFCQSKVGSAVPNTYISYLYRMMKAPKCTTLMEVCITCTNTRYKLEHRALFCPHHTLSSFDPPGQIPKQSHRQHFLAYLYNLTETLPASCLSEGSNSFLCILLDAQHLY
jgi:hypothetical protein